MPALYAAAIILACAAGVAVLWGASAPVGITVDGVHRVMQPGATVADVVAKGFIAAHPGALVSSHGDVLRLGGGDPISVWRNGAPTTDMQRLFDGDVLTSVSGANRKELAAKANVSAQAAR